MDQHPDLLRRQRSDDVRDQASLCISRENPTKTALRFEARPFEWRRVHVARPDANSGNPRALIFCQSSARLRFAAWRLKQSHSIASGGINQLRTSTASGESCNPRSTHHRGVQLRCALSTKMRKNSG